VSSRIVRYDLDRRVDSLGILLLEAALNVVLPSSEYSPQHCRAFVLTGNLRRRRLDQAS